MSDSRNFSSQWVKEYAEDCDEGLRRKKNTRRWCRGKVGDEHSRVWVNRFSDWKQEVCEKCGRHFGYMISSERINFGEKLRTLRKEQGISQVKLAELSGLAQEQLSFMENESRRFHRGVSLSLWQKAFAPLGFKLTLLLEEIEQTEVSHEW